jgi:glycosyltransferase involved in cell wall biosynthesis
MPGLYRTHDVLAFTSTWKEPFGLTHLEAMASGTPVVSTTVGGQGEFLRDGENALTVPAGDSGALADSLERIVRDDALRRRLAFQGRKTVEQRFTLSRYVDELDAWLTHASQGSVH